MHLNIPILLIIDYIDSLSLNFLNKLSFFLKWAKNDIILIISNNSTLRTYCIIIKNSI